MKQTWEELHEEYSNDQYPAFGGPFTDALDPWEWLSKNFDPPKRTEKNSNSNGRWNGWIDLDRIEEMKRVDNKEVNQPDKIKVKVEKDSEAAKMIENMKKEKQDFKNRVESGQFSNSDKNEIAVDWLIEMLIDNKYLTKDATHLFEQAKRMFYEQIRDAWVDGYANHRDVLNHERIEKYYKSRYGK